MIFAQIATTAATAEEEMFYFVLYVRIQTLLLCAFQNVFMTAFRSILNDKRSMLSGPENDRLNSQTGQ